MHRRSRMLASLLLAGAACGSGSPLGPGRPLSVPARAATGAESLLALVPPGADAVAEIDVARLRDNPVVGRLLAAVPRRPGSALDLGGFDPLRDLDAAVAAVYRLGEDDAATLFLLRGERVERATLADTTSVDRRTVAVGAEALRARALARAGAPPRVAPELLALRAAAMPERATGAAVRITARLTPRARIASAGRLGVDEVPETVSLWLDVADDAALVAVLGGDDEADALRLAHGVELLRERLGGVMPRPLVDRMRVEVRGRSARVVWVLPPARLRAWAEQLEKKLGGQS